MQLAAPNGTQQRRGNGHSGDGATSLASSAEPAEPLSLSSPASLQPQPLALAHSGTVKRRRGKERWASSDQPPHFDGKMLKDVQRSFAKLDTNNDGTLSRPEFSAGLGMLGINPEFSALIFNAFDTSGDGAIDRREFVTTIGVMLHPEDLEKQVGPKHRNTATRKYIDRCANFGFQPCACPTAAHPVSSRRLISHLRPTTNTFTDRQTRTHARTRRHRYRHTDTHSTHTHTYLCE